MPRYDSFLSLQSTPWFQAQFDLTLAALGKNVKKQQEVSDLNQDYIHTGCTQHSNPLAVGTRSPFTLPAAGYSILPELCTQIEVIQSYFNYSDDDTVKPLI